MHRQDQIVEARKLLGYLEKRTTALAEDVYRNPVGDYTCPQQAERERELFFRKGAFNVGLSALLPNPGDWMTHDYSGVPILLSRDREGKLGAYLNVCRHRGARVANGSGSGEKDFRCPYHGWCYGLDGKLIARPDEPSFAAADARNAWPEAAAGGREIRDDLGQPRPRGQVRRRRDARRHGRRPRRLRA